MLNSNQNATISLEDLLAAPRSHIFEVRLKQSQILRVAGNDSYKNGLWSEAQQLYERALHHADFEEATMSFEFSKEHRLQVFLTTQPVLLNLARCALQDGRNRDAIRLAKEALTKFADIESDDSVVGKVHYLCGKAYFQLGEYAQAQVELEKSLSKASAEDIPSIKALISQAGKSDVKAKQSSKVAWKGKLSASTVPTEAPPTAGAERCLNQPSTSFTSLVLDSARGQAKVLAVTLIPFAVVLAALLLSKYFNYI